MDVAKSEGFSALVCPSCGGMFYPEGEFNKHLEIVLALLPPQPSVQELKMTRPPWALTVGEKRAPCPGCRGPFKPFNYAYRSNIILAKCPSCHGIWVEPGEMLRVARFRLFNPGTEHLVDGIAKTSKGGKSQPAWSEEDFERQLPRINPLGCLTIIPVPVSNAPALSRYPVVTWTLVVINVVLFLLVGQKATVALWGIYPAEVTRGVALHTYVTYQFAHDGLFHLAFNMIYLLAFGDRVEDRLGPVRFILVYIALGVVAGAAHVYMMPNSEIPMVGASGAISGILGLYFAFFPRSSIRLAVLFMTIPIPAAAFVVLWFLLQLATPSSSAVAVAAHLGGFLAGLWVGVMWRLLRGLWQAKRSVEADEG